MKTFFKKNISTIAIIIAVLFVAYILAVVVSFQYADFTSEKVTHTDYARNPYREIFVDTGFGGILSQRSPDDTLPHREYQRLKDSLQTLETEKEYRFQGKGGSSRSIGSFGITTIPKHDIYSIHNYIIRDPLLKRIRDSIQLFMPRVSPERSADSIRLLKKKLEQLSDLEDKRENFVQDSLNAITEKEPSYYLTLSGYSLDPAYRFFVHNGIPGLGYIAYDTIFRNGDSVRVGYYARKISSVRYSADEKKIMIPISNGIYHFLKIFFLILMFIVMFIFVYVLVGLPLQVLINISRGGAFTEKNIRSFSQMSGMLLFIFLVDSFAFPIITLIFNSEIPAEFEAPDIVSRMYDNILYFILAVVLFIIGRAFRKGYKLQQEQDLTV
jgi:hypothetical protein